MIVFFCDLRHLQQRVEWEDELLYMVFDNFPVSPGHTLLIPKRHVKDFVELSELEWIDLRSAPGSDQDNRIYRPQVPI